jgi:hypothetical protein
VKTSNSAALTSRYNNFSAITTQYSGTISDKTGDKNIIPSYDTFTYGKGAYLMVPDALQGQGAGGADMGAEVLYQAQDRVLTNQPLWPWPMEDRYYQETGRSVTWEAHGGLWKSLDGAYATTPVPPPATPPADTIAPSAPAGLSATAVSSSQINLSWNASTDNTGVAGYKVYKSGNLIGTTTSRAHSDTGLLASTIYSYSVAAFDAVGNTSALSAQVSATTPANTVPTAGSEIIIDNNGPGTSSTGTWGTSGATGSYGANSLWSRDGATYTWKAGLPQSGTYKVYMQWSAYSSRSTSAPVTVAYNGGTKTVTVNQQQNGGTWNLIGTFSFDATKGGSVTLSAPNPSPTSYSADAVKFVYTP